MKIKTLILAATVAGLLSTINGTASAATLDGDGFTVHYDTPALGSTGLFGIPTLSQDGKTILFSPLNFEASSFDKDGTKRTRANVQIDIILDDGKQLSSVSLLENGDYRLINETGSLTPSVDASGELRLTNLFNATQIVQTPFSAGALTISCSTTSGCPFNPWTATATSNTPSTWLDNNGAPVDIRVRLQNNLLARSNEVGDSAEIEKKHASQTIAITPHFVPVPGAVWLFGSAIAGLVGLRRKK